MNSLRKCRVDSRPRISYTQLPTADESMFPSRREFVTQATSLGGVETLASTPFNSSHFNMTPQERLDAGILPGMLRLAVGLEGEDALRADLRQAIAGP